MEIKGAKFHVCSRSSFGEVKSKTDINKQIKLRFIRVLVAAHWWFAIGISVGRKSHLEFILMHALSQIIRFSHECKGRSVLTNVTESARIISTRTSRSVNYCFYNMFCLHCAIFKYLEVLRIIMWVLK